MKIKFILILFSALFVFVFTGPVWAQNAPKTQFYEAAVQKVTESPAQPGSLMGPSENVTVKIESGPHQGKTYTVQQDTSQAASQLKYTPGDRVMVSYAKDPSGETVFIVDFVRSDKLLWLFLIFLAVVFTIGRWQGFTSFLGMIFSFVIIGRMIIPSIMLGNDPIIISLLGSLIIIPVTFYLAHGINKKTTMAVVSTFFTLILTAILAYVFIELARLTGLADEQAAYLQAVKGSAINIKSLLLAGIIIGALGVLDDITISQTSLVSELRKANPKFTFAQLYGRAMSVGRDHIASIVNTLVLVYAGAALPLFLLFYNSSMAYGQVVNQEIIAVEIVRTLVSSIGIVAAVPIATLLACWVGRK